MFIIEIFGKRKCVFMCIFILLYYVIIIMWKGTAVYTIAYL